MINIKKNVSLAPYTTFKIGGPAKFFVEAKKEKEVIEALKFAQKKNLTFFVLGGGSNVLISDKGFDGLVIKISDSQISIKQNKINCASGVLLSELIKQSRLHDMTGMEWATGIPGTVGGAIYGNAAAYGSSIGKSLLSADVIYVMPSVWRLNALIKKIILSRIRDNKKIPEQAISTSQGDIYRLKFYQKDCQFSYRESLFSKTGGFIILSATFLLEQGKRKDIEEKMNKTIKLRSSKIPKFPSPGSLFLNPIVTDEKLRKAFEQDKGIKCKDGKLPAGWIIDQAGLRGKKIGGAMVSEKHANFIVNIGGASAEDVIMLASLIKQQVRDKFGIELQEEVQYLGF